MHQTGAGLAYLEGFSWKYSGFSFSSGQWGDGQYHTGRCSIFSLQSGVNISFGISSRLMFPMFRSSKVCDVLISLKMERSCSSVSAA